MSTIEEALRWSGSGATLSLFLIYGPGAAVVCEMSHGQVCPKRVRSYELEDLAGVLGDRRVLECDAEFDRVPDALQAYLAACLEEARRRGAEIAWFAFEGSFDFEFLLTAEVASQIYALADKEGVSIATDDSITSAAWKTRVLQARERVVRRPEGPRGSEGPTRAGT